MKEITNFLKNDRVIKFTFFASSVLFLANIVFLSINFFNFPPMLPIYFGRPWGSEQLGKTFEIFLIPLFTLVVMALNTASAVFIYKESPMIARILLSAQSLFCLLTLIAIIQITLLVL